MELPLDLSIKKTTTPTGNVVITEPGYDPYIDDCSFPSSNTNVIVPADVDSDVTQQHGDIKLSLVDANVWKAFSNKGTEMIINRGGRRMFPHVAVTASGLSASGLYNFWMEIVKADDRRYKYVQNAWISVGLGDPCQLSLPYLHPDSPNTGSFWMQKVSFARLKLTNYRDSSEGNILLQSMHKYKAKIHITAAGTKALEDATSTNMCFDETTFIAVTAYQNSSITKLKIHNNPFAKAFRDKHLNQARNRVFSNASKEVFTSVVSPGEQDIGHTRRKRKNSGSNGSLRSASEGTGSSGSDGSGSSGSVTNSANFSHALQQTQSSGMLTSPPWAFSSQGEQDIGQTRRKRNNSESDGSLRSGSNGSVESGCSGSDGGRSSGSVGNSINFSHALQQATSSAMLISSPWTFNSQASPISFSSRLTNSTRLPSRYTPYRPVSRETQVWSVAPLLFQSPPVPFSASYLTSRALCSTTSSLPSYQTVARSLPYYVNVAGCQDKPSWYPPT